MTLYANIVLRGNPQYIAGVILLGLSPCTAMVMWWMFLAKGDMAQGLINTAVNALLMLFLYAPLAAPVLGRKQHTCAVGSNRYQRFGFHSFTCSVRGRYLEE